MGVGLVLEQHYLHPLPGNPGEEQQPGVGVVVVVVVGLDQHNLQPLPGWPGGL